MRFSRHIGIDYSGAQTPEGRLKGLQVSESRNGGTPERIGKQGTEFASRASHVVT